MNAALDFSHAANDEGEPQETFSMPKAGALRIDRYELKGLLGHGAMGQVYLAEDPKLQREVAIKIVSKPVLANQKARERFHREARCISQLKHPNIVEIFDYSGQASESLYLVMERLNGADLYHIVDKRGPMPEPIAAAIIHELCLALEHAHGRGVIHRDIKPENVLVEWSGRVVLTDFGLVKAFVQDNLLNTGSFGKTDVIGTPGFMAPEQMKAEGLGPYTDVFAVGALFYNLLTSRLPYLAPTPYESMLLARAGKFDSPAEFRADLSENVVQLIHECLAPQPGKRPPSARAVRERLAAVFKAASITDPREEIAAYLKAADKHTDDLRQRELGYVRERLKLAIVDDDAKEIKRLRRRLLVLTETASSAVQEQHRQQAPREASDALIEQEPWWRTVLLVLALGLAVGVGAAWLLNKGSAAKRSPIAAPAEPLKNAQMNR